jgi:hypothetical protein
MFPGNWAGAGTFRLQDMRLGRSRPHNQRSKMFRALAMASSVALLLGASVGASLGQGAPSPQPGPTNPTPPPGNPQAQPGATIVINPTVEECRQGWNSSMKWSKEQFDHFCATLQASK